LKVLVPKYFLLTSKRPLPNDQIKICEESEKDRLNARAIVGAGLAGLATAVS